MENNVYFPLEHLNANQSIYADKSRTFTGEFRVSCQITAEKYLSLDGKKIKTDSGTISFKRWTKIVQNGVWAEETEFSGQPYMHQIDRIYVSLGWVSKYGYTNSKLGYIEVADWSSLIPDDNGNNGLIHSANIELTTETIANAIVQALR